jgi:hypothetical protein
MRWYAVLFWIWVAASLAIFVWRRLNRQGSRDDTPTSDESSPLDKQWAPPPPDPDAPLAPSDATATTDGSSAGDEAASAARSAPVQRPTVGSDPPALTDLLEGIALPHGLVPLTQAMPTSGRITSLVAATDTASAEEVGTALADELERLGYVVATTGIQTAVAEGPRGAIDIEVHPHAGSATDGGALRFPTAAPGSVVVELRVAGSRR